MDKRQVFTFRIAPLSLVEGEPATVITTNEERRANMEKIGVDYLVAYPFTEEVRRMAPADFVRDVLLMRRHARALGVGPYCSCG